MIICGAAAKCFVDNCIHKHPHDRIVYDEGKRNCQSNWKDCVRLLEDVRCVEMIDAREVPF